MEFSSETKGGYLVVSASGHMDTTTAQEFEAQCEEWIAQGTYKVVVNMSGVEYISSAGLRSVLVAGKKLKAGSGELRFCGLTDMVREVFTLSGFGAMFKIFETPDQAVSG
ncbi:MAG: STAS domain-containing protein [Desulfovibrionaceae bacterium]|jgi:anti-sigma B factor antagonist